MSDVLVISDGDIFPSSQTAGIRKFTIFYFLFFKDAAFKVISHNLKFCLSQNRHVVLVNFSEKARKVEISWNIFPKHLY